MKRILLFFSFCFLVSAAMAQTGTSCTTCPPSGTSNSGKVLMSNGGNKPVYGSAAGFIKSGNGTTINVDSVDLGGTLNKTTVTICDSFRFSYYGYYDTGLCIIEQSNDIGASLPGSGGVGTGYSGVGIVRIDTINGNIYFLGCIKNNSSGSGNTSAVYGIATDANENKSFMVIEPTHQKWIIQSSTYDTSGIELDTNETWVRGHLAIYDNGYGGGLEIEDNGNLTVENGKVGIGTVSPAASSVLDIESTTKGFLPPQMTTAQKTAISSPKEGLVVYDLTLHMLCYFNGTIWVCN